MKRTLMMAALAATLAVPAMAQQPMSGSSSSQPSTSSTSSMPAQQPGFVQQQGPSDWRSSKLVGASVYGSDNSSIGEINDLILADNGQIKAAVIGVGGLLGVGQKDVAVPFQALNVKRKANSASIDKITVSFTKDQLKSAPTFAYYSPSGQSQTTGSGSTSPSTTRTTSPLGSPARPAGTPMSR